MKNKYKIIIALAVSSLIAFACEKKEDVSSPSVTIESPTTGQQFRKDSVIIAFTVTDEDIHEISYTISRKSDDSLLYSFPATHTHEIPFVYRDTLSITVPGHSDAIFRIFAEDHNGNTTTDSVACHIHPM